VVRDSDGRPQEVHGFCVCSDSALVRDLLGVSRSQPIHALRLAYGAQRALLPVAVGAMNIDDVCDRRRQASDRRQTSDSIMA